MASLNKVMLIGRLTADPDQPRTLPNSGATAVKFRFAVGRSKKNPQTGQWENDPNPLYIDCEVIKWPDSNRDLCSVVSSYCQKGSELYIEGQLRFETWDDKNTGDKRSKHTMQVTELQLLGGKTDNEGSGQQQPQQQPARQQQRPQQGGYQQRPQQVPQRGYQPAGAGYSGGDGDEPF